jgi:hypothetical protein
MSAKEHLKHCEVIQETPKALKIRQTTPREQGMVSVREFWVPKSIIDEDSEVWEKEHRLGTLVVPFWFAEKEKLT